LRGQSGWLFLQSVNNRPFLYRAEINLIPPIRYLVALIFDDGNGLVGFSVLPDGVLSIFEVVELSVQYQRESILMSDCFRPVFLVVTFVADDIADRYAVL
jgi:hypothetical protein